ncbi:C2H2 finger domain protein [Colletotrichum acutatum]|uniref:C2H2 finger domain protein n=1 Tax=Glomerella acutata TaxID=27357 RepID=A0AAD8X8A3_GLOAC|nr:C2H2 finger domain protein [Colletotrichum acutatum]KAK1707756.1 C2H2 finger domain protein [Colletotrichum acutatum]
MAKRRRTNVDDSDSDASFAAESESDDYDEDDVFDTKDEKGDSSSDATDIDDLCDDDVDVEDQIRLFDGNLQSSEYWRHKVEAFTEDPFACQDYSPGTTVLLDAVEEQWRQFCCVLKRDPKECYAKISLGLMYNFFDWVMSQKIGKNGRKKRGIKKKSSLGTYWKVFRLVFERAVGEKINQKLNRSMHRVLRDLGKKHRLSEQRRVNRCMTIDDLKLQIETTLSTTKKSFKLGELRILAVLFLLLLAPAGSRPEATLNLRFKDIRVVLARDPEGGPHKLLLRFTPEFTKSYLGEKEQKTYSIPETMFDPSLLLSPHVFLLGVLFRHRAFNASSLTSPHHLDNLDIHPGERELPLPLREDLNDTFIFRRVIETFTGYQISTNDRITSGMMAAWIQRIGEILGFEYPTIAYNLRYNAANAFDQSVDVSEALRNLALGHGNSDPFQRHYLGRNISADLWGVLRGQKPQQALMKQSCSIGHSISERRPTGLTTEQSASVATHPTIRELTKALRELPQGSKQYNQVKRARRNEKQRLRRELKQRIRDEWTDKQATDDIERQIHGIGFDNPATDNTCRPQGTAQRHLMKKLTAPTVTTLEGQYRRRDEAIEAVSTYCLVQEGCTVPRSRPLSTPEAAVYCSTSNPPEGGQLDLAIRSVFITNDKERPKRCFICIGQALDLTPDGKARLDELTHEFYTSNDLTKHFRNKHLSKVADGERPECKVCKMTLEHKMHLQNHAMRIHGTVS